jgi:hypothetical protein
MDLKKLVRMGTWFIWPRIWPHGGLCELRNKRLVSKKYVALRCYLIECEHLKLVDWCMVIYRGANKSLVRPSSRCILFDCENISFDASLVMYINSTNIPLIMIINRIYEHQNILSL